jgi:hypothetical protein
MSKWRINIQGEGCPLTNNYASAEELSESFINLLSVQGYKLGNSTFISDGVVKPLKVNAKSPTLLCTDFFC